MAATGKLDPDSVSIGMPLKAGAVYVAPAGTDLPTDATTDLDAAFVNVGYISEDGITNTFDEETSDLKAYGGVLIRKITKSRDEQFGMTFIQQDVAALKIVYGSGNVSGSWDEGITVKHSADDRDEFVYVIETLLAADRVNRVVIPRGKAIEIGDVERNGEDPFGYETTVAALADSAGYTAYEYFAKIVSGD